MGKIFDLNNPVWTFVGRLVDAVVLHVLWFVCSLPIITFGASTAALHYAMMKDVADEDPHYVKAFFRSFKMNFKPGIPLGLIFLVFGGAIGFALYFYFVVAPPTTLFYMMRGATILMAVVFLFIYMYAFPLLARFDTPPLKIIRNAFLMSIRHIGWTLAMIIVLAAPYVVIIFTNFLPLLILGYGLVVYLNSFILNHIFAPYIKAAGGGEEERDPDAWEIPEEELVENAGEGLQSVKENAEKASETAEDAVEQAEESVTEVAEETAEVPETGDAEIPETGEAEEPKNA